MKGPYVPDRITRWSLKEAVGGFAAAFFELELSAPTRLTLCVLVAQSALETGWWKSCHCNNPGNSKATEEYDGAYTSFRCSEVIGGHEYFFLPDGQSDRNWAPPRAEERYSVPPGHPYTRFQAFETAAAGIKHHLERLKAQWPAAWRAALRGDSAGFAHALKLGRYYTASEAQYTKDLVSIASGLMRNPLTDLLASTSLPRKTLRLGSEGPDVEEWQCIVGVRPIDGKFCEQTELRTKAFQAAHGLSVDGVVGPKTWAQAAEIPEGPPHAA